MTHQERRLRKYFEEKRRWHEQRAAREAQEAPAGYPEGMVAGIRGRDCEIIAGNRLRLRTRGHQLAPGDRVLYSGRGVEHVLPRRTTLARTDGAEGARVLAANIDIVGVVASCGEPPLRPGLLDRYLIAIRRGGADPLLCINKWDLSTAQEQALLRPYEEMGVSVLRCSARTGSGLDELRSRLAGKLCVFTGHSGVGKSSLLNALAPGLALRTGAVREATGKGQHTTTTSSLHDAGDGIRIIDTPGVREFGIGVLAPDEMHEFGGYAELCRFRDCTHTHEPGCAVKAAVEIGDIAETRYRAYLRLRQV